MQDKDSHGMHALQTANRGHFLNVSDRPEPQLDFSQSCPVSEIFQGHVSSSVFEDFCKTGELQKKRAEDCTWVIFSMFLTDLSCSSISRRVAIISRHCAGRDWGWGDTTVGRGCLACYHFSLSSTLGVWSVSAYVGAYLHVACACIVEL